MRTAFRQRSLLVYFRQIKTNQYLAVWPIIIINDNPHNLNVEAAMELSQPVPGIVDGIPLNPNENRFLDPDSVLSIRRYATHIVKRRLHQQTFRSLILDAYGGKCTVCSLQHRELLDAAHIIPDANPEGTPAIPNGLSLCKIHHTAYDQNILGISPDYRVHIREDILNEIDGPMLKHGFQEMEDNVIHLPRKIPERPSQDRLAQRFDEFRSA